MDILPVPMRHSVPTQYTPDPMHAFPLRLDYTLVTSNVKRLFDTTLTIVDDDVTNTLSDHFPLLLTMQKRRVEEESKLSHEKDKEELCSKFSEKQSKLFTNSRNATLRHFEHINSLMKVFFNPKFTLIFIFC